MVLNHPWLRTLSTPTHLQAQARPGTKVSRQTNCQKATDAHLQQMHISNGSYSLQSVSRARLPRPVTAQVTSSSPGNEY